MNAFAIHSSRTLVRFIVLGIVFGLGLALVPAGGVRAADDVTWTVRTASNEFGADRTSYSYSANPGTTVKDALVVVNRGSDPLDLGVYASDGYTTDSGQFDLLVAGRKSVSIGAWVTSDVDHITVGPGETREFPFTLSIPENATPGDYAGGIVTSLVEPNDADGINVDRRLGIRIALRVGGELKPSLAIDDLGVGWNGGLNPFTGGDATIAYSIHNTGNAVLTATQSATVTGPFGWFPVAAGAIDAPPQLLPGESWKVTVPVNSVSALVLLIATATVTPVLIDASGSSTALAPVTASASTFAVPWLLLLLIVVVIAIVIATLRLRRRARESQKQREDALVKEAVELALSASAPAKTAPSKRAPTKAVLTKTVPTKTVPTKAAPAKTVPAKTAPPETVPTKRAPQKTVPEETSPGKSVPQKRAPQKTALEKNASETSAPRKAVPRKAVPKETVPKEQDASK